MVRETVHVSAKQILKWIMPFYRAGVHEVAGLLIEAHPYHTSMAGFLTVVLTLPVAGGREMIVLHCEAREDLSGPVVVQGYAPGVWTADLHLEAILAYDDSEDEA